MIPLLQTTNLSYTDTLKYNDISIHPGKIHFIVSESGSGKSTLLKLFNQTLSATTGDILYQGKSVNLFDPIELRREVSLVSQEVFLFEGTILDNFQMFYEMRDLETPSETEINKFTELCCVNVPLTQSTDTLSGGERQRVYLSIFLSFMPKVLLLDEPTSALDEKNSHQVIGNIIRFAKENGMEVIIVSHDTMVIEAFCEEKVIIVKGGTK